jgi:hypothetical protein
MDLLAAFRDANRAFFDSIFLPDFCDAREPIGAFRIAGLFTASRYWLATSREYRAQLAEYNEGICADVAKRAIECSDPITCKRACQCLLVRLAHDPEIALKQLCIVIDAAIRCERRPDICETVMNSAISKGPRELTPLLSHVFNSAIILDRPDIFECAMAFNKYLFHSRRIELDLHVAVFTRQTKCTRIARVYEATAKAHAAVNEAIIAPLQFEPSALMASPPRVERLASDSDMFFEFARNITYISLMQRASTQDCACNRDSLANYPRVSLMRGDKIASRTGNMGIIARIVHVPDYARLYPKVTYNQTDITT